MHNISNQASVLRISTRSPTTRCNACIKGRPNPCNKFICMKAENKQEQNGKSLK